MTKTASKTDANKPTKRHSVLKHSKKVFDVVPPGKAPAAANSRSVPALTQTVAEKVLAMAPPMAIKSAI